MICTVPESASISGYIAASKPIRGTLKVEWQVEYPAHKKPCSTNPQKFFFSEQVEQEDLNGHRLTEVHLEK